MNTIIENPARTDSPAEGRSRWNDNQLTDSLIDHWLRNTASDISKRLTEYLVDELDAETIANIFRASFYKTTSAKALIEATVNLFCTLHGSDVEAALRPSIEDEEYNRQLDAGEI